MAEPMPAEVGQNTVAALTAVITGDDAVVAAVLGGLTRSELEEVVAGLAGLLQGTVFHVARARGVDPHELLELFTQETGAHYA